MPYGYTGKILRVDLKKRTINEEKIEKNVYRLFMGGSCLAAHYMLRDLKPRIDPLSPANILILSTGVLTGVPVPGSAIFSVVSKSPQTGGIHEAPTPGFMGEQIKKAGYDAVIISGASTSPVILKIHDNRVEFLDASGLWGLDTADAIAGVKEMLGEEYSACAIGIAGENLVSFASIVHDYMFFSSRGGLGAVMGSKRIKAIAVHGTHDIPIFDRKKLNGYSDRFKTHFLENPVNKGQYEGGGHAGFIDWMSREGILSAQNARYTGFKGVESIDGTTIAEKFGYENISCANCFGGCKRRYKTSIECIDPRYGAPELETLSSIAVGSEIEDMHSALMACDRTSRYGLDGTSSGIVLAFANECAEIGILTRKDFGGIEPGFGKGEVGVLLLDKIARREGIGDILAGGVRSASEKIGGRASEFALHVKGMEVPLHDPRVKSMLGLGYAVNPNGPVYTTVEHDTDFDFSAPELFMEKVTPLTVFHRLESSYLGPEKVRMFYLLQPGFSMLDAVGACIFAFSPVRYFDFRDLVVIIDAVTGWETSLFELFKAGERRTAMFRRFNTQEGFSSEDDRLPDRYFQPIEKGPKKGIALDREEFERAKRLCYGLAGWDETTGSPRDEKLLELGIGWEGRV